MIPTHERESRKSALGMRRWPIAAAAIWVAAVVGGMRILTSYESTPGPRADTEQTWPVESTLRPIAGRPTLIVLAHPHCTCTRASLNELNVVLQRFRGALTAYVLFVRPHDMPERWEQTDSWRRAQELPGAIVLADRDGVETKRFGAYTSGQTLVYDAQGRLIYNGGLTAARGHEGDNVGRRTVLALLNGEVRGPIVHNVFGCFLLGEDDNARPAHGVTGD